MSSKSVCKMFRTILLLKFITLISCSFYSYSACNSTSYLNTANFQCTQCSTKQIANSYQVIPISCQCAIGYVVGNSNTCTQINTNLCTTTTTYYPLYTITGDVNATVSSAACSTCASNAYANQYYSFEIEMLLDVFLAKQVWFTVRPKDVSVASQIPTIFAVI